MPIYTHTYVHCTLSMCFISAVHIHYCSCWKDWLQVCLSFNWSPPRGDNSGLTRTLTQTHSMHPSVEAHVHTYTLGIKIKFLPSLVPEGCVTQTALSQWCPPPDLLLSKTGILFVCVCVHVCVICRSLATEKGESGWTWLKLAVNSRASHWD